MQPHGIRDKVQQLAADFSWLEEHCRRRPELAVHAARLRLAAALTRNVVGPALDGQPAVPLFVAVVGGAGTGKSTVVNLLAGAVVAEANPQAGFTRHPTAYLPAAAEASWPAHLGFLGPLRRLAEPQAGDLDDDVYQVRRIPAPAGEPATDPLAPFAVWDCPDMTTWAATGYVSRLIEVAALADVVVYVASDERYNDEVPTEFLQLLVRAGKAVVCCLTKMKEADTPAIVAHFRQEILSRMPAGPGQPVPAIPCVAVPQMTAAERADPAGAGVRHRVQLLNQLLALCPSPEAARRRTVRNAVRFLTAAGEGLLDVAKADLAEVETWKAVVRSGRAEFEDRYRREYLAGEPFRRFDRTRDQLFELIDLPGSAKAVSAVFAVLRAPYRYGKRYVTQLSTRPAPPPQTEQAALASALGAWLDGLQAETLRRAGSHPVWKHLAHGFESGLKLQAADQFRQAALGFEAQETDELEQAGRALTDSLAAHPGRLAVLRGVKLLADLAAVVLVVWATWPPTWHLLILIPLAVSLTHQVAEWVVTWAVDARRNQARADREALLARHLSGPLAAWLEGWPGTGGTAVERIQQVLVRVPALTRDLADAADKL